MYDVNHAFAGFWRRAAAWLIDQIVIFTAARILAEALLTQWVWMMSRGGNQGAHYYREDREDFLTSPGSVQVALLCTGLFAWLYHCGMESSPLRATLGKLAAGLVVTDLEGERISFARATGRHFGKIASGAILGVGYLLAGFSPGKQALHDSLSGSLVLDREPLEEMAELAAAGEV